ncbi:carboxypeptidase regulatory-like domain-containing protein [Acidipila sp. EB88]|nr:carboxypeptidase regulatory-like domain-containing protein [Acidipila sp. EB88]
MLRMLALIGLAAAPCAATTVSIAATLRGTVQNRTNGKPSAGDIVALIALDGQNGAGMQVAAQTTTDAAGRYSLEVPDQAMHLVRVSHQKAAYFAPATPGSTTVNVDVYDVAPAVAGITTEADVLTMQTAPGGELRVVEDYFVRNASKPARTQLSDHAYEFYLPEGVKVVGTAAKGPNGMPVESSPVPLPGKGHYAFIFPLRPGQTRFQVSYTLPYSGKSLGWTQRESLATENLVVLLPKSMRFTPEGTEWQPVPANPEAQTFVRKGVAQSVPVAFSIGGQGELPRDSNQPDQAGNAPAASGAAAGAAAGANVATQSSMQSDTRPGGGLGPPVDTPDPLQRYKPWLLGGLGVLLLGGAVWLMRAGPAGARGETATAPTALRPALEQALLALEREYAAGRITPEAYTAEREALQRLLHAALAREAAAVGVASR